MKTNNHLGSRGFTLWMWGAVAGVLGLGGSVAVGAQSGASSTDVTFTKDIAPILQRHCQSCHRRGFTLWMWGAVAGVLGLGGSVAVGAQSDASSTDVTFTKDIAPTLQRHCQSCHRPDSLAPMSLLT